MSQDRPTTTKRSPAEEALEGVLDEIEDYLEQRQDVKDGSYGEQRPNTEMGLLSDLRWWRDSARRTQSEKVLTSSERNAVIECALSAASPLIKQAWADRCGIDVSDERAQEADKVGWPSDYGLFEAGWNALVRALKNAAPQAGEGPYSSATAAVHPEKPAVAAPQSAAAETPLNCDRDAARWAREFNRVIYVAGREPLDEGLLIGWFANAMMCGEDTYRWRQEKSAPSSARETSPDVLNALRGLHKAVKQLSEHFDKPITDENVVLWLALNSAQAHAEKVLEAPQSATRRTCPYCTSDNPAIRGTYYDQTCEGCVKRMGQT